MNDISNLRDTIVPKSDQLNADQLVGGELTITITGVSRADGEQPLAISYDGDGGRPWKPCKSMRKVLIYAWGDDGREWVGRRATLFNDPDVKYGGVKVGGIRISRLSDIAEDFVLSLAETRGKKRSVAVRRLGTVELDLSGIQRAGTMDELKAAFDKALGVARAAGLHTSTVIAAKDLRKKELANATDNSDDN